MIHVLTTTELAAKTGVSRQTIEREIHRGNLDAVLKGRVWLITDDEGDRWAASYRPYAEQHDRDRAAPSA